MCLEASCSLRSGTRLKSSEKASAIFSASPILRHGLACRRASFRSHARQEFASSGIRRRSQELEFPDRPRCCGGSNHEPECGSCQLSSRQSLALGLRSHRLWPRLDVTERAVRTLTRLNAIDPRRGWLRFAILDSSSVSTTQWPHRWGAYEGPCSVEAVTRRHIPTSGERPLGSLGDAQCVWLLTFEHPSDLHPVYMRFGGGGQVIACDAMTIGGLQTFL